jgi:GST-like protein
MSGGYLLYSDVGSGAVAVEAALVIAGQPYEVVEAPTSEPEDKAAGDRVLAANPLRQVPALILPTGVVMTESAAILIHLGELFPHSGLAPAPDDPRRPAFLRWMAYVSAAIYSLYWVKDKPGRLVPDPAAQPALVARALDRISTCWEIMERQLSPGRYILGEELTALDLYVTVVSRFRPGRRRFYAAAPRLGAVVRRVDADPRLTRLWAERYPFVDGWER